MKPIRDVEGPRRGRGPTQSVINSCPGETRWFLPLKKARLISLWCNPSRPLARSTPCLAELARSDRNSTCPTESCLSAAAASHWRRAGELLLCRPADHPPGPPRGKMWDLGFFSTLHVLPGLTGGSLKPSIGACPSDRACEWAGPMVTVRRRSAEVACASLGEIGPCSRFSFTRRRRGFLTFACLRAGSIPSSPASQRCATSTVMNHSRPGHSPEFFFPCVVLISTPRNRTAPVARSGRPPWIGDAPSPRPAQFWRRRRPPIKPPLLGWPPLGGGGGGGRPGSHSANDLSRKSLDRAGHRPG